MKTFKQISAQIERIERLYYSFGCGTEKMLEKAEKSVHLLLLTL